MKIAVIAANGRSGRVVVDDLLRHGHSVVAGVRGEAGFEPQERLTIRQCDATVLEDVMGLAEGCDAIASFIGHVRGSKADVQTAAIMNVVRAAHHLGIRRVVSLTGTGVRFPGDRPSQLDKILNRAVALVDPARIKDGIDHAEILKASGLDWTLIRVLKLTNGLAGAFHLTSGGPGKLFVPRAEVALAVRQVLEETSFVSAAPVVSAGADPAA